VNLDLFPILGRHYAHIQWSSQWISDAVQSPEKPFGVDLLDLVRQRKMDRAMTVYWQMQPLIQLVYDVQASLLPAHPWQHMKYYQWVMGGNGGLLPLGPSTLRDPQDRPEPGRGTTSSGSSRAESRGDGRETIPALDAGSRRRIRETCQQVGIAVDRPEDEFIVGRVAYAKGVRPSDMPSRPLYT
jgi:4-hydroxy-tetrahydrodipicolinate synthase